MGAEPWRLVVASVFVLALAGAVAAVVMMGDGDAAVAVGTVPTAPPPPTTTTALPATAAAPTTVPVPVVTTTPLELPPPEIVLDREIFAAAQRALAAWGEFAVTGDLDVVADTFDPDGPQYEQLVGEASSLAANPLGPPPYVFAMGTPEIDRPRPRRLILTGPVVLSRPGEPDQLFTWRLHLRWSGTEWLVWTVDDVTEG